MVLGKKPVPTSKEQASCEPSGVAGGCAFEGPPNNGQAVCIVCSNSLRNDLREGCAALDKCREAVEVKLQAYTPVDEPEDSTYEVNRSLPQAHEFLFSEFGRCKAEDYVRGWKIAKELAYVSRPISLKV